eukprot:7623522-Pyramimonas_sp.AAC.1
MEIIQAFIDHALSMRMLGRTWILAGDFNMAAQDIQDLDGIGSVCGIVATSTATTCRQTLPGTIIDSFIFPHNN